MKYPDRMARRGAGSRSFHTAISTTFAIEFAALEEIMLPQLMASGATNLLVIADARMASMSLSDGSQLPTQLGRVYELTSPAVGAGVFHPKILLQIGRRAGRLFVSSANITASGLAGNAEAVIELECSEEPSPEREIVRTAWQYLSGLVTSDASAARDAVTWASERAPWLLGSAPDPVQHLEDGTAIAFLSNASDLGISRRFIELVADDAVERLVVASPYWDESLAALRVLRRALDPEAVCIFLDFDHHEFPVEAATASDLEFRGLPKALRGRFAHAKIVIASTADHDHVLVGSANCTEAALGRGNAVGINAEACIYRRLPRDAGLETLDLLDCLAEDPIDAEHIEPRYAAPPIPLNEMSAAQAGSFELDGGVLSWLPPPGLPVIGALKLLDRDRREVAAISYGPIEGAVRQTLRVDPDLAECFTFAVVVAKDFTSAPAHVTHRSQLRRLRREAATGVVARAIDAFDPGNDFDLWMHSAFDDLARADLADRPYIRATPLRARARREREDQSGQHLTYDEFMEVRSPDLRGSGDWSNSLAGTHSDSIRSFLNALVGRAPVSAEGDTLEDDDWLDMGDEDEDRQLDVANADIEVSIAERVDADNEERKNAVVDARMYAKAVQTYVAKVTESEDFLGPSDVLRMRFWLMLLLNKSRHPSLPKGLEPSTDESGWPRMAFRVIAAFFCGRKPPVTRLMVSRDYTEMPVDFLEGWTTALWTLDAIIGVVPASPRNRSFLTFVEKVRVEVLRILGLTPTELGSETVVELCQALDRTIGRRIGYITV